MSNLIIYGSSSGKSGTTWDILTEAEKHLPAQIIDLTEQSVSYYDYTHQNQNDDFRKIAQQMIAAKSVIFATPVYWYSMSAQLKTFFDRLNDLITLRKEWGRQLAGKQTVLIATGYRDSMPSGFEVPFKETSRYFNMQYRGHVYISSPHHKSCDNAKIVSKISEYLKD